MCNFIHELIVFLCMYVFLFSPFSVIFSCMGLTFLKHAWESVGALMQILNSPGGVLLEESMWLIDVNYVTQKNSYVQLLATLYIIVT